MASIKRRTITWTGKDGAEKSAERWQARYRDEDDREHARLFKLKKDAQAWIDRETASVVRGDWVNPSAGKETFRKHAERWLEIQPLRASTRYNYGSDLRRHIVPAFGDRQLSSIAPSEVQAWVSGLPLAASTAGRMHSILFSIMAAAVVDRKIKANPCEATKLPKDEVVRQVVPMTTEQMLGIADGVPDRLRALIVVAAGTGMRQSEIFGLTLDRVDFLRRTVRVDRQLMAVPGESVRFGPPKTKASIRTIPLPQVVVDALAEHLSKYPVQTAGDFAGLIFTREDGEPWTRQRFGHVWRPVVRKVGLTAGTGLHAMRHYYASLLIRHGESVKTVQARLGHASASETLDTYSHLWPDSDDRTRDAVDAVLGNLADSTRTVGVSEA